MPLHGAVQGVGGRRSAAPHREWGAVLRRIKGRGGRRFAPPYRGEGAPLRGAMGLVRVVALLEEGRLEPDAERYLHRMRRCRLMRSIAVCAVRSGDTSYVLSPTGISQLRWSPGAVGALALVPPVTCRPISELLCHQCRPQACGAQTPSSVCFSCNGGRRRHGRELDGWAADAADQRMSRC